MVDYEFDFVLLSFGLIVLIFFIVLVYYIKKYDAENKKKDYAILSVSICIIEFFFIVDPILDYNCAYGESSIWYSGYIPNDNYTKKSVKLVELYDEARTKRFTVWKAGNINSYVLFSCDGSRTTAIKRNINDIIKNYCAKGITKDKRKKVIFLLELENKQVYDDSSLLGKEHRIISAVVEKHMKAYFYNVICSDNLIWYNSNDNVSQIGDSVLIMFDIQERYKYNIFKRNPTKDEFEKYKYGVDL